MPSTMPTSYQLSVQPDWDAAITDRDTAFWVSSRRLEDLERSSSHHGRVKVHKTDAQVKLSSADDFTAEYTHATSTLSARLKVIDNTTNSSGTFVAPRHTYRGVSGKKCLSLDISPGGELGVVGGSDGQLTIFSTDDGSIQRILKGHVTDVDTCRFFPSGQVVLSGDLALRIWDINTGDCAAALTGHVQGITDTAIVDRGRNIISTSRDGTARLWDCGTQRQIASIMSIDFHINQCAIAPLTSTTPTPTDNTIQHDERENGTQHKALLVACQDGTVRAVDLFSRTEIARLTLDCEATSCAFGGDNEIMSGSYDGHILHWDMRQPSEPMKTWRAGTSAVLSITSGDNSEPWISLADGRAQHGSSGLVLTGADCDPCYRIHYKSNRVYTACRDGAVRVYDI